MGGKQLFKIVDTMNHIKQINYESLGDFYTRFNKELVGIDQVVTEGELIRACVRELGPQGIRPVS